MINAETRIATVLPANQVIRIFRFALQAETALMAFAENALCAPGFIRIHGWGLEKGRLPFSLAIMSSLVSQFHKESLESAGGG